MIKIPKHKLCEGCRWDGYPVCKGTIMLNGSYMNIESLKEGFECGQKDDDTVTDFSIKRKSALEIKIEELENRINDLESTQTPKS